MKKRIVSYALIFTLVASFAALGLTYGSDDRERLDDIQQQIGEKEKQLEQGKKVEGTLLGQINTLEKQMMATQAEIDALRGDINATQGKIDEAVVELADLEAKLSEQNDNLNARLRAMYMNGNVGFFDVLLGSNSISDFMTNMDRVQLIYESDKEVIESLEEQHKVIETQKKYLQDLQAELVAEREAEAAQKEALQENQDDIAVKKQEVAANNKLLEQYIDGLNKEADAIIAEILAKQSDAEYVGGEFMWPVPGVTRTTSEFGYRNHPILKVNKLHTGLDIAAPSGTNVVAANAGKVIKSGWNNSYGNVVMIDHGGGRVTLYAHNSQLLVSENDIVARGEVISKVGSTGMSTGPHLHFEVRINGDYKNPREWL